MSGFEGVVAMEALGVLQNPTDQWWEPVFNFGRHFQLSSHPPGISSKFVNNPHLNFPSKQSNPYWEWVNFGRKNFHGSPDPSQLAGNGSLASCAACLGERLRDEGYFGLKLWQGMTCSPR